MGLSRALVGDMPNQSGRSDPAAAAIGDRGVGAVYPWLQGLEDPSLSKAVQRGAALLDCVERWIRITDSQQVLQQFIQLKCPAEGSIWQSDD